MISPAVANAVHGARSRVKVFAIDTDVEYLEEFVWSSLTLEAAIGVIPRGNV
jgi:hypothetical protein